MKTIYKALVGAALISVLAVPAWAATQWNFGASLMFKTFWTQTDFGKFEGEDLQGGGAALKNDGVLDWTTQGDSTISGDMRSDSLEGYLELNYDVNENKLTPSQYWGKYYFNDNASILIGQTENLFRQFTSSQVGFDNINLNGIGTAYAETAPMIALQYGGFSFALVKPEGNIEGVMETMEMMEGMIDPSAFPQPQRDILDGGTYYDMDTYMPQIQASYEYFADSWRVKVSGGYANFKVKNLTEWTLYDDGQGGTTYEEDRAKNTTFHSWIVGLDGDINFGPLYLAAAASVGQNWGAAGWNLTDFSIGSYPIIYPVGANGGAFKDTTSVMASIVAAYQLTEALRFEAGAGYRYDNSSVFDKASHTWAVYLQADYAVADGFYIIPEIGYIDHGDTVGNDKWVYTTGRGDFRTKGGKDLGYTWYAGVQWKMDF